MTTITDNFNRPDSGTTLNPPSDGGVAWGTNRSTIVGIQSNAAFMVDGGGNGGFAYRNTYQVDADFSLDYAFTGFSRAEFYFAFDPVTQSGYMINSSGQIQQINGDFFAGTNVGAPIGYVGSGAATTTRITYNHATGVIEVFVGGVSQGTRTDGSPITGANNTGVGFGSTQTYYVGGGTSGTVNTGETWDNFSATASPPPPTPVPRLIVVNQAVQRAANW